MQKFFTTRNILLLSVLSALTFFGFIDDKFRGWEDTNQYQLEAQAWSRGSKPPVEEILADLTSTAGPAHVPVLVPFSWSYLLKNTTDANGLYRIKFLQAILLSLCFLGLVWVVGENGFIVSSLMIAILIFFNEFSRQLVSTPISEPMALFLLILAYVIPAFSGISAALQLMVRPVLIVLYFPLFWRLKKSVKIIISGFLTLFLGIWYFRSLILPGDFKGRSSGIHHTILVLKSFIKESAYNLFDHLLPYDSHWFFLVWTLVLTSFVFWIIYNNMRRHTMWIASIFYLFIIMNPWPQGVRYFIPLIVFILLELKPKLPKNKLALGLMIVLSIHLIDRQIESIFEFKKYNVPETQSVGLVAMKNWLKSNGHGESHLLMNHNRYCINFFKTTCYGFAINFDDPIGDLKNKKIEFIVFTGIGWQTEEPGFEMKINKILSEKNFDFKNRTMHFEGAKLVDIRAL